MFFAQWSERCRRGGRGTRLNSAEPEEEKKTGTFSHKAAFDWITNVDCCFLLYLFISCLLFCFFIYKKKNSKPLQCIVLKRFAVILQAFKGLFCPCVFRSQLNRSVSLFFPPSLRVGFFPPSLYVYEFLLDSEAHAFITTTMLSFGFVLVTKRLFHRPLIHPCTNCPAFSGQRLVRVLPSADHTDTSTARTIKETKTNSLF